MSDNDRHMYELQYPSPEVTGIGDGAQGPTLVVALQGYADAGHAIEGSADHLLAALENRRMASFNLDELIDYRSRRPVMSIDAESVRSVDELDLSIRVVRDTKGKSFLLLSGPEPDLRWHAFTEAVASLVDKYHVEKTLFLYSAPMTVPHTRPLTVSGHSNSPDLVRDLVSFDGRIIVPGSASLEIERTLAKTGHTVAGYTAHVPHYVSSSAYPEAMLRLLGTVADKADLALPLLMLEKERDRVAEQLAEQTAESPEIQQVVAALEQQYDEEVEKYRSRHPKAVMPGEEDLPSGEEISEEFERFLAELDRREGRGEDNGEGHGEDDSEGGVD